MALSDLVASEGEGFGLPLIEAARHKPPIIARDIAVFREVANGHVLYFAGREPVFAGIFDHRVAGALCRGPTSEIRSCALDNMEAERPAFA